MTSKAIGNITSLIALVRLEHAVASHGFQHACSVTCGTVQDGSTLDSVRISTARIHLMSHAQVGSFLLAAVVGVWHRMLSLAVFRAALQQ